MKHELRHHGKLLATGSREACEYAMQRICKTQLEPALASGDWTIEPAQHTTTITITKQSKMNTIKTTGGQS
jgi:hypothetical protein